MVLIADGCYNDGWWMIADGFYDGWCLQRMAVTTDGFYNEWWSLQTGFITDGFYNGWLL